MVSSYLCWGKGNHLQHNETKNITFVVIFIHNECEKHYEYLTSCKRSKYFGLNPHKFFLLSVLIIVSILVHDAQVADNVFLSCKVLISHPTEKLSGVYRRMYDVLLTCLGRL